MHYNLVIIIYYIIKFLSYMCVLCHLNGPIYSSAFMVHAQQVNKVNK
jgi:hypothetical protein